MMFEEMAKSPAAWLSGKGEDTLVVLSTRVRIARNVAGCKYPPAADLDTKNRIVGYFDSTVTRSKMLGLGKYYNAGDISNWDRDFLIERHLISPLFLNGELSKSLYISPDEKVSIMVCRAVIALKPYFEFPPWKFTPVCNVSRDQPINKLS